MYSFQPNGCHADCCLICCNRLLWPANLLERVCPCLRPAVLLHYLGEGAPACLADLQRCPARCSLEASSQSCRVPREVTLMLGYWDRRVGVRLEVLKGWCFLGQAMESPLESQGHCVLDFRTSTVPSAGQLRLLSIWSQHVFHLTWVSPPLSQRAGSVPAVCLPAFL